MGSSPGYLPPKPVLGPHSAQPFLFPAAPISCLLLVCFFLLSPLPEQALKWSSPGHTENTERGPAEVCAPLQACSVWPCHGGRHRLALRDVLCIIVYNGKTTGCLSTGDQIKNSCDFCTMDISAVIAKNKIAPYRAISKKYH